MSSEKPSFSRFGGSANFAGAGQVSPRTVSPNVGGTPVAPLSSEKKWSKTASMLDGVISVALVALFFGLPLFFTGTTFQGIAFEKQIYFYFWLLIGTVAWVSKGVIVGEMRIRH